MSSIKKLLVFLKIITEKIISMMEEKKMAKMPRGSSLIYNPSSAAPGFKIKNVLCFPGVPSILNSMIDNSKNIL